MEKLSFVMENYLEAIYELSGGDTGARVSDIANKLKVTKATTNSAIATLRAKGLVTMARYREVHLTEAGRALSMQTAHKHHVIFRFLSEILAVDASTADMDACAIEHVISSTSVMAMRRRLDSEKECHS